MATPISSAFVDKYNKPGPRYTSYPTVPAWKQEFGDREYREALGELKDRPSDELAIYLHLPFCAKACHYCGCNMLVTRDKGEVDAYLDRLEQEIAMVTKIIGTDRRAVQVHWGGGTPNFLKNHQVERVLNLLKDLLPADPGGGNVPGDRPADRLPGAGRDTCAKPASTASAWACRTSIPARRRPSAACRAAKRP